MTTIYRLALVCCLVGAAPALAQTPDPQPPPAPDQPPAQPDPAPEPTPAPPPAEPPPLYSQPYTPPSSSAPEESKPKEPKRGDFDAGGKVRFPSGPDEMGTYETYNWIALDLVGRYFLLDGITVNGHIPIAIVKPDRALVGDEIRGPGRIGGMLLRFDLKLPKAFMAKMPTKQARETELGLSITGAYMHEGAMLLSERDFPLFVDGFHPGLGIGLITRLKLGNIVHFNLVPTWTSQYGDTETRQGIAVPMDLTVQLGSLVKVALELGVFTGDDYSGRGRNGGRIPLGASIDVKLGRIIAHLGAGFATLTTGPLYPSVRDSVYLDLNVKFAK